MEQTSPNQAVAQVLVAEDNRINQRILKELLRKEGCTATLVDNGKQALAKLAEQAFDLLILDYHMPELNGLDTMKAIRNHPDKLVNTIKIILFTAEQNYKHLQEIHSLGVYHILQKPVNQTEFSAVLQQLGRTSKEELIQDTSANMNYLRHITSDNKELMMELIDIFLEEVPQAIKQIQNFYEHSQWNAVQTAAHKLRSNYKYVGAGEAEAFLKTLETDFGDEQNKQSYASAIEALQLKTSQIIKSLVEEKQKLF